MREGKFILPHDESIRGRPLDWLARARGHLALAKQTKPEESFWEDLCFQAQQAAEKAIKAVYQHKELSFRYTHDLEALGKGLEDNGVPVTPAIREAAILTKYASETRYPGPFEPVTQEEYQEAVRLAESVVAWAAKLVSGE
jgi:HEPN domain-containing protein